MLYFCVVKHLNINWKFNASALFNTPLVNTLAIVS